MTAIKKGVNLKNISKDKQKQEENKSVSANIVVEKINLEVSYENSLLIIDTLRKHCSMETIESLVNSLRGQVNIQVINCATEQGIKIN